MWDALWVNLRVATMAGNAPFGLIEDGAVAAGALTEGYLEAHPVRTDQLAPPPEMEQVDMSDQDRRAIEGMLEGLGYL